MPKYLIKKLNSISNPGKAKSLFMLLKDQPDTYKVADDGKLTGLKSAKRRKLNDFMETFLGDDDPDQCIEEEYKHKKKPLFCWRFLRHVSYLDQGCINIKTFTGDVSEVVTAVAAESPIKQDIKEEQE